MSVLWAKSPLPGEKDGYPLAQHLLDVEEVATILFSRESQIGRAWRRFFKLNDAVEDGFMKGLRIACLLHDFGKANTHFQGVVRPGSSVMKQAIRHEHLSALMLGLPDVREWFSNKGMKEEDLHPIFSAVLSHHFKASPGTHGEKYEWMYARNTSLIEHMLDHKELSPIWTRIAEVLEVKDITGPRITKNPVDLDDEYWAVAYEDLIDAEGDYQNRLNQRDTLALHMALKMALVVCDAVGSAIAREDTTITAWATHYANLEPLSKEDICEKLLDPLLKNYQDREKKPLVYQDFQEGAAELGDRALLMAACGAGKTLAAYLWAKRRVEEDTFGHIIFLYPTRGTATEGYKGYASFAGSEATLLHGTSHYEIDRIRSNPPENRKESDFREASEEELRLRALGMWGQRYITATVDQFLSFMTYNYKAACMLPVFANSVIVLDEIHSYDTSLQAALKNLLNHFDVPILSMTATLPENWKHTLINDLGLEPYPKTEDTERLEDLTKKELAPRYHIETRDDADLEELLEEAITACQEERRVLWVVNTVNRCQDVATRLEALMRERELDADSQLICYHSRFRLEDRHKRHEAVVDAFKTSRGAIKRGVIAVTTQVCEMSLDLDADLLITERCAVSGFIQRCGRAHRKLIEGRRARILVYTPEKELPYSPDQMAQWTPFLEHLQTRTSSQDTYKDVSQRDLADAFLHVTQRTPLHVDKSLISSGSYALREELRDIDQHNVTCLLQGPKWDASKGDVISEVITQYKAGKRIDGFLIPVPRSHVLGFSDPRHMRHKTIQDNRHLPSYVRFAPSEQYDPRLGFRTTREEEANP